MDRKNKRINYSKHKAINVFARLIKLVIKEQNLQRFIVEKENSIFNE